jgi:hypothetical protein
MTGWAGSQFPLIKEMLPDHNYFYITRNLRSTLASQHNIFENALGWIGRLTLSTYQVLLLTTLQSQKYVFSLAFADRFTVCVRMQKHTCS